MKQQFSSFGCLAVLLAGYALVGQAAAQSGQAIVVKAIDQSPTPLHGVVAGTVLVWHNPIPFYVHFFEKNPCKENAVANYPGYYGASATPGQSGSYTVQCTVAEAAPKGHSFGYRMVNTLPPLKQGKPMKMTVVQCSGCAVDTGQ